ncbi:non-canonical purine NTP pyrophosphatase, RdgB/HAM1 family [Ectothiorhodospira shaposhnikovii]|uniref:RdgB/HAM1 family non-canonical purine NTP pyrophosphatase n=1 Tax=Ectothiorhodospira shaposhnikovii TaxID=1054 RepID=UPI001906F434|nr:RdgB/HAM1 family non-canonical purine NTP pyrophosphatase [Ectothiorhodospira shaposhnikovii]MBK1673722.1 non-canonical purine NTP pyrophosphatase, RdgB/HAM1 family [Ectothiorhodospira shaposhnikovii]
MKIVLATGNTGKVREFSDLLAGSGHEVLPQSDFQVREAEETGLSFVENAILKARNAAEQTGLPAMADDSGIEVDALDGVPGIYSARYAGPGADAEQNNGKLLEALKGVPEDRRTARFRCVIAFLRHARDPSPIICEGTWEGAVALRPAGDGGHGYDPVFLVPELGLTAAQISAEEKNRRSHRGQALTSLLTRLGGSR